MSTAEIARLADAAEQHVRDLRALFARLEQEEGQRSTRVTSALNVLDRQVDELRTRADKQLVRVLEAVRAGYDTSALVAAHLSIRRDSAARSLATLESCGTLTRAVAAKVGPGRKSYRYAVVASR